MDLLFLDSVIKDTLGMHTSFIASSLLALGLAIPASAIDIIVPDDHATIQGAIDAAAIDGDTIKVRAGDYPEWIDLGVKNLIIESYDGAATTFIGSYDADTSIVRIVGGQTSATELRGFTIRKGRVGSAPAANPAVLLGGGLYVFESNPLIENCTFTDNRTAFGGGCYIHYGGAEIRGCTFYSNTAQTSGGGLQTFVADVHVEDCVFEENNAVYDGGGTKVVLGHVFFEGCTFVDNVATEGGGVYWFSENNPNSHSIELANCSITLNYRPDSGFGGGIRARYGYTPVVLSDTTVCDNTPDQIYGPIADMGGNTLCICPADFNNDGTVDGGDLGILLAYWGSCSGVPCFEDLNQDGVVDGGDLGLVLSAWGQCFNP